MKMLVLHVGINRYAIDHYHILRIIPPVILKPVSQAPHYVAGMLDLGGYPVPIIDFCYLVEQRPAQSSFHSRIILLQNSLEKKEKSTHLVGLLAEQVVDMIDLQLSAFSQVPLHYYASYINGIYTDSEGMMQRIDVNQLFKFLFADLSSISGV